MKITLVLEWTPAQMLSCRDERSVAAEGCARLGGVERIIVSACQHTPRSMTVTLRTTPLGMHAHEHKAVAWYPIGDRRSPLERQTMEVTATKRQSRGLLMSERMLLLRRVEMGGMPVNRSVSPFSRAALSLPASAQAVSSSSGCTKTCHVMWASTLQSCRSACLYRRCEQHISGSISLVHSGVALLTAVAHLTWCTCRPLPPLGCPWLDASA